MGMVEVDDDTAVAVTLRRLAYEVVEGDRRHPGQVNLLDGRDERILTIQSFRGADH